MNIMSILIPIRLQPRSKSGMTNINICAVSKTCVSIRLQQIKSRWRENGRVREAAKRLSPPCRDLLDHIFDLNEKRRLSIAGQSAVSLWHCCQHCLFRHSFPPLV